MWDKLTHVSGSAHNGCHAGMSRLLPGYAQKQTKEIKQSGSEWFACYYSHCPGASFWSRKRTRFTQHALLMLMSLLTIIHTKFDLPSLSSWLWIIHEIGISWEKWHFLTVKSRHRTYWDGWQLMFIGVQQNLFRRWLRAPRTRTLKAQCFQIELNYTEYLICGCRAVTVTSNQCMWSKAQVDVDSILVVLD